MKRGYSQLNSLMETTQLNYSLMDTPLLPVNELEHQSMLRTALQMQKTADLIIKQCKQQSDQMLTPQFSYKEEISEIESDAFIGSMKPSCSSKLPKVGNTLTTHCENTENERDAFIGSQSRTSSESSYSMKSSCSSGLPSKHSKPNTGNTPTQLRHFNYQPITITFKEFEDRLATQLSEATLQFELLRKFPFLHDFRSKYIIPLTEKFRGHKHIDLADLAETDEDFRTGFLDSYNAIFVEGCHIPRETRSLGKKAKKETKERIMYRHLIFDLWEMLGLLFLI